MELEIKPNVKTTRIRVTPLFRLRVLTNQRTQRLRESKLISLEFISDMQETSEKLRKSTERSMLIASMYLAVMYIAYTGSGLSIKILGLNFSDVPKLLEISIALFSFSLFFIATQLLNQEILRQSIDSMIGAQIPDDEIFQTLIKYRAAPVYNYFFIFKNTLRRGAETIRPVGITVVFNFIAEFIALIATFLVFIIPIIFLLAFAVPSMLTSVFSIGIGLIAWMSSLFLLITFVSLLMKFPYDETIILDTNNNNNENAK